MNVYKRMKKLNEMKDNLSYIELSKDILTGIVKVVTRLTSEFVYVNKNIHNKDLNDDQKILFIGRYKTILDDVERLKKEALNAGISNFGLWLRRNKIDKTLLYISSYCKKSSKAITREQKKIIKEMKKLFIKAD